MTIDTQMQTATQPYEYHYCNMIHTSVHYTIPSASSRTQVIMKLDGIKVIIVLAMN